MADVQDQKNMSIDDLVRELSKSSTSPAVPTPPLAPISQAPRPSFPTPKPMTPPPLTSPAPTPFVPPRPTVPARPTPPPAVPAQPKPVEISKPQFNVPAPTISQPTSPKPAAPPVTGPVPTVPAPSAGVKEYQSSIRTMSEDISKIKQGQQPTGTAVPRKVEQAVPFQPGPAKPTVPAPQFKVPEVNLGDTKKSASLAPTKTFPGITIPDAPKAPSSVMPSPKTGGTMPSDSGAPKIYVPEAGQSGGNRNMLFIGIGAVAVVAGFAYWFFVLRSPAPVVVIETPTPTPTETPTPVPTPTPTLISIFSTAQQQSIIIKSTNILTSFVSDIGKAVVDPGTFKTINATDTQTASLPYGFADLIAKLTLKVPSELMANLGTDSALFVYGQKEFFDPKGNLQVGVVAPNRMVMVAELKSTVGVAQAITTWETSMSNDLKVLFGLGAANKNQPAFADNSYRNTSIRFKNFSYADKTIDYAIVMASTGRSYLVVADSREAIFAAIDKLMGF